MNKTFLSIIFILALVAPSFGANPAACISDITTAIPEIQKLVSDIEAQSESNIVQDVQTLITEGESIVTDCGLSAKAAEALLAPPNPNGSFDQQCWSDLMAAAQEAESILESPSNILNDINQVEKLISSIAQIKSDCGISSPISISVTTQMVEQAQVLFEEIIEAVEEEQTVEGVEWESGFPLETHFEFEPEEDVVEFEEEGEFEPQEEGEAELEEEGEDDSVKFIQVSEEEPEEESTEGPHNFMKVAEEEESSEAMSFVKVAEEEESTEGPYNFMKVAEEEESSEAMSFVKVAEEEESTEGPYNFMKVAEEEESSEAMSFVKVAEEEESTESPYNFMKVAEEEEESSEAVSFVQANVGFLSEEEVSEQK